MPLVGMTYTRGASSWASAGAAKKSAMPARNETRASARSRDVSRRRFIGLGRLSLSGAHVLASHQEFEQQAAPRLELLGNDRHFGEGRERPLEFVLLADCYRPTTSIGFEDEAQVHCANGVSVVVEHAQGSKLRQEVGFDLLLPFTSQPARYVGILGIDVAADADRVAVV